MRLEIKLTILGIIIWGAGYLALAAVNRGIQPGDIAGMTIIILIALTGLIILGRAIPDLDGRSRRLWIGPRRRHQK